MYLPDGLLTSGFLKHDVEPNPHIIAPDPFASDDCLDDFSPVYQFPPLEPEELNTMNPSEDEPSSGLNGRLRPRKSAIPSPVSIKQIVPKLDGKQTQEKSKRSSTPSKASPSKPEDLSTNSNLLSTPQLLCPYCDRKFGSKQNVSKHIRRTHLSASKIDSSIVCLFCNHDEAEPSDIIRHMIDSHPNQYFACLDCHTRFPSTKELAEHKLNICEKQKIPYRSKLRRKTTKKSQKALDSHDKDDYSSKNFSGHSFNGIVISCELKPTHIHDEADIEDNITTNLILPPSKNISPSAVLEKNAVIVLDDIQWNRRIPSNFSFHNTDADQILSRLGVVHRSPKTGESTKKHWIRAIEDATQKFEKCFDTSFYSKVASNVQENLTKFLDGSFNFNPDPDSTIKTRKSKNSVVINTAEGFPILLACEQFSRNTYDGYIPRSIAPKHKWKWDNLENEKPWNPDEIKRDTHANNCIITLISSLDIWTQLRMRHKFEDKFNITPIEKKTEKQNVISKELKEILESREIPAVKTQVAKYVSSPASVTTVQDFPTSLGLIPSVPKLNVKPAILSGEWVRPRCYVCCACGAQSRDSRALSVHVTSEHPNAQVQHYEIVGESLLKADILKHLYVPPNQNVNRTRPPRGFRDCTKCLKSITSEDLHQHMLDCAGDTPTVRRKCRYRPFGVRRRRPRLPDNRIRKKMRNDIRTRPTRQKSRMRPKPKIRSEVGDAETIRKMLADLPAKRHRVLVNPLNSILRPRRKLDKQRAILMMKRHTSDDLRSVRSKTSNKTMHYDHQPTSTYIDRYKSASHRDDEDNEPLKPRMKRVTSKLTRQKESLNRKAVLKKPKRKVRLLMEKKENEDIEKEIDQPNRDPVKVQSEELSADQSDKRVNLNGDPQNTRENSSGRDERSNERRDNQRPADNNENDNAREVYAPAPNVPLKHSIARLTANSETHDKSVQFHQLFLVQQECNNANAHVPTGQRVFFEDEAVVMRLDKPPLHFHLKKFVKPVQVHTAEPIQETNSESTQSQTIDSALKNKLNKPRKGLNDCIAMLKNKLVEPDPQAPAHVSVQCGTDDPISPDPVLISPSKLISPRIDVVMKAVQAIPNAEPPKKSASKSLVRNEQLPNTSRVTNTRRGQLFNHDLYGHVTHERQTAQWRPVNYDAIVPRYIENRTRKESSRRRSTSQHENMFYAQQFLRVTPPNDDMLLKLSSESYNPYNLPARKSPKKFPEPFIVDNNKLSTKSGKRKVIDKNSTESARGFLQNCGKNVNNIDKTRKPVDSSRKSTRTRVSAPKKQAEMVKYMNVVKDVPKSTMDATEIYRKKSLDVHSKIDLSIYNSVEKIDSYPQNVRRKSTNNMTTEVNVSQFKQVDPKSTSEMNVQMPAKVYTEHNRNDSQVSIPFAHARTRVESILTEPLDLSSKPLPVEIDYSCLNDPTLLANYDRYETLDLSNKRKTIIGNSSEDEVVDLRVKHNLEYHHVDTMNLPLSLTPQREITTTAINLVQNECVPTDLSLKRKEEDTNICINLSQKENVDGSLIQDLSKNKTKTSTADGLMVDDELPTDLSNKKVTNIEGISDVKESNKNDINESLTNCVDLNEQNKPNYLSAKEINKKHNDYNSEVITTDTHVIPEITNTNTHENINQEYETRVTTEISVFHSGLSQIQKPIYDPTLRIPQYKIRPTETEHTSRETNVTVSPPYKSDSKCLDSYSSNLVSITTVHSISKSQNSVAINSSMIASIEAQERITYSFTKSILNTAITSVTGSLPTYSLLNRGITTPFTTFESTRPVYALPNSCISMAKIDVTANSLLSIPSTTIMSTSPVYTLAGTTLVTPLNYVTLPNTGQSIPYPPPGATYIPDLHSTNIQEGSSYDNSILNKGTMFSFERDHEISRHMIMLPREIGAILRTMPIDHRNQLLDVLSQYLSTSRPIPVLSTSTSLFSNAGPSNILAKPIKLSKEFTVDASTDTVDIKPVYSLQAIEEERRLQRNNSSLRPGQNLELAIDNQVIDNQVIDSQVIDNQVIINQVIDNQVIDNQVIDNQVIDNQVIDNQVIDNQVIDNQFIDNQFIDNQFIDNQFIDNQVIDNQVIDNQVIDNQVVDNQVVDNQVVDNQVIDNQVIDNQVIDNQVIDNQVIDNQVIENQVIDNQVIDLTYDEIVPKVDVDIEMNDEQQLLPIEEIPVSVATPSNTPKTSNDKTASLRAVRIKAPSERQQLKIIVNPIENVPCPDIPSVPVIENQDIELLQSFDSDIPSDIQLYEVSSTQSNKNKVSDTELSCKPLQPSVCENVLKSNSDVVVQEKVEDLQPQLENQNIVEPIPVGVNSVICPDAKEPLIVTEKINLTDNNQLNGTNSTNDTISVPNMDKPLTTSNLNSQDNDDDSDDDVSLAVIIKQKQQNEKLKMFQSDNESPTVQSIPKTGDINIQTNKFNNQNLKKTDDTISLDTLQLGDSTENINKEEANFTKPSMDIIVKTQQVSGDGAEVKIKPLKRKDKKSHSENLIKKVKIQNKKEIIIIEHETIINEDTKLLSESGKNNKACSLKLNEKNKAQEFQRTTTVLPNNNIKVTENLENIKHCNDAIEEFKDVDENEIKYNIIDKECKQENKNIPTESPNVTIFIEASNTAKYHNDSSPVTESFVKSNSIVKLVDNSVSLGGGNENFVLNNTSQPIDVIKTVKEDDDLALRRSMRGKSLYVEGNGHALIYSDSLLEQKAPLTKKQLIFSKLLLDEEKNLKPLVTIDDSQSFSGENISSQPAIPIKVLEDKTKPVKRKKSPHAKKKSKKKKCMDGCENIISDEDVAKVFVIEKSHSDNSPDDNVKLIENISLTSQIELDSNAPPSQDNIRLENNNEVVSNKIKNVANQNTTTIPENIVKRKIEMTVNNDIENSTNSSKPKKTKLNNVNDNLINFNSETITLDKNNCNTNHNLPLAARRARSKSVVVKSSGSMLYDPYDIDLEDMGDKTEPFRKQSFTIHKVDNYKSSKEIDVPICTAIEKVTNVESETNLNTETVAKESMSDSDESSKSDVPLKKYVEEKERKSLLCDAGSSKLIFNTNNESLSNDNEVKQNRKKNKKNKRFYAEVDNVQKEDKNDKEVSEEQLRSEQFMESFGFFSERKPRKSNLLATKKISETFNLIANESDDIYYDIKERPSKKISRNENKKTVEEDNTKNCKPTDPSKISTKSDKNLRFRSATLYCHVCKKEFRRTDNLVRHQLSLSHASKVSESALQLKTAPIPEELNYLVVFKEHIDRLKILELKMKNKKNPKTKFTLPSLHQMLVEVRKSVREQQLARRNLSRDQALFLDCCELLKDSNRGQMEDRNINRPLFPCCPSSYALACTNAKEYNPHSGLSFEFSRYGKCAPVTADLLKKPIIHTSARPSGMANFVPLSSSSKQANKTDPYAQPSTSTAVMPYDSYMYTGAFKPGIIDDISDEKDDSKSEGDVDSITAQNILESEEVRNLENDLLSGLKEADCKFQPLLSGDNKSPKNFNDSSQVETDISMKKETTSKIRNSIDSKEKKNLDIPENIDIFEDKFDKIKRKCRSQAAAAKLVQTSVEPATSHKSRKKSDKNKKKGKKNSKKHNKNTVLTKGALKGYDSIKVSILTSEINMSAIVPPIVASSKKKKKRSSKKKRDKKNSILTRKPDSHGSKESSLKNIDVYEFLDNEEPEIFELRPSTVMERFRNLNKKEIPNSAKITSNRDETLSSGSVSDGDDFVYMSDDYVCSDDETENSLMSCELGNVKGSTEVKKPFSPLKRKDVMEKNAVMGKIFKHNAVRSEKKILKPKETTKPKANLDQLFDSLLEEEPNSSMLMNDSDSPTRDIGLVQKKRVFSPIILSKYDLKPNKPNDVTSKIHRSPSPALSTDSVISRRISSFSSRQSSPRRLSSSRYDISSPFDYEPTTSKRNDNSKRYDKILKDYEMPLTNKYEICEKKFETLTSSNIKLNEDVVLSPKNDKLINTCDKSTKDKTLSRKKEKTADYGICYDYQADYYDDDSFSDDAGVARQRARRKCTVGKQNILAETWSSESELDGVPPRPNSAESVVLNVARKRKGRKREGQVCGERKGKKHVSVKKQEFESRVTSSNRNTGTSSVVAGTGRSNGGSSYTQQLSLPGPSGIGPRLRPTTSFWTDGDDEPEHVQQHGWIVGDSHKKLVTMLAHAKGRKRNNDDKVRLLE